MAAVARQCVHSWLRSVRPWQRLVDVSVAAVLGGRVDAWRRRRHRHRVPVRSSLIKRDDLGYVHHAQPRLRGASSPPTTPIALSQAPARRDLAAAAHPHLQSAVRRIVAVPPSNGPFPAVRTAITLLTTRRDPARAPAGSATYR
ncbi:hypothetical protein T440DRAFT_109679 [Plenodomus tracheiphilus IPT5]|uniref:Uncharacterized protein n=1 Tax=Plenodomus tracheiphilus IPT5 TaxID=1408161 RepID=A0A6A7B4B4_9PLEO|nr:hypothetical protein T440DRAFT_109679 [Plenodomus tracheiphilus IPT5]